jgi:peptidoglycan hydrolase-like protein with peptidoglycan-binding domain
VQYTDHLHKKWEVWAIPACSGGVVPPAPTPTHKTIKRGSKGEDVVECQTDLIQLGYDVGPKGADGIFGAKTEEAVKAFQSTHTDSAGRPLKVDGIVGSGTWWALDEAVKPGPGPEPTKLYTVHIPHQNADQCEKLKVLYPDCWTTEE